MTKALIHRRNRRLPFGVVCNAFTLIELLVVIAVIAVVAGVLGLGFAGGGNSAALQGGQGLVNSLLSAARGKAAITNKNAAVIVWGDPNDADSFLRKLAVFIEPDPGVWQQSGDAFYLPQGVFVVPPDARNNSTKSKLEPANADWITAGMFDARSHAHNSSNTATMDPNLSVREPGATSGASTEKLYRMVTLTHLGRVSGATVFRLVVAPGVRDSGTQIIFREPEAVLGLDVSTYGVPTLINAKEAFRD